MWIEWDQAYLPINVGFVLSISIWDPWYSRVKDGFGIKSVDSKYSLFVFKAFLLLETLIFVADKF